MAGDPIAALTARLDTLDEINRALAARCFAQASIVEAVLACAFKLAPDFKAVVTKTLQTPMRPGPEPLSFAGAEWWSDVEVKRLAEVDALLARAERMRSGLD